MGVAAVGLLYAAVKRTVCGRGRFDRRLRPGPDARGGPDVPVQQPRRHADPSWCWRPTLTPRAIEKAGWTWLAVAGAVIGLAFLSQDAAGIRDCAGPGTGLSLGGARRVGRRLPAPWAAAAGIVVVAGSYVAALPADPGLRTAVHGRLERPTASWNSPSATTAWAGFTGAGGGARPAGLRRRCHGRIQRRTCRWFRRCGRERLGFGGSRRDPPHVRHQFRRRGVLAAAGGPDPAGRRAVVHPARARDVPNPCGAPALGRLAGAHSRHLQLHERHRPPVLCGGAGPGDRGAGRHRFPGTVAGPGLLARPGCPGRDGAGHLGLVRHAPGPGSGLASRAPGHHRGPGGARRRGFGPAGGQHGGASGAVPQGRHGRRRDPLPARRRAREHRLDAGDRRAAAFRFDPHVRAHRVRDGRRLRGSRQGRQ